MPAVFPYPAKGLRKASTELVDHPKMVTNNRQLYRLGANLIKAEFPAKPNISVFFSFVLVCKLCPLFFDPAHFAGFGIVDPMAGELKGVSTAESPECDEKNRKRHQPYINGNEQYADDGGRNTKDMQEEADAVAVALHPVIDQRGSWQRRADHRLFTGFSW
jgi:hypothetical protein